MAVHQAAAGRRRTRGHHSVQAEVEPAREMECSICGGHAMLVEELRTLKMGNRPVTFMDWLYRCERCGEGFFTFGEMLDDSFRRATAVIRAEDGLLAPDEIVAL